MSDYGDHGSNDVKSEAASPSTVERNNGAGPHPTTLGGAVRHHLSATPTVGVDGGHSPQFVGTSSLAYASSGGGHGGLGPLIDGSRGCPSLTAGPGLDDDGGFLAMNVAAAAAAAAAAGTFNIGYNRL